MKRFSRIAYLILPLLALLIVPAVHAQDTSNQILYAVHDENGDRTIYSLNVDEGLKTQIGIIHNSDSDAGWSPDGKFIYLFDNNDSNLPSLTLIDANTNHSQPIPDQIENVFCGLPFEWSPKGKWLVYTTQSDSQPIRKIYNPTTGDSQILTNANVDNLIMHWSSDNRYLTYETQNNKLAIWDVQNQRIVALPEAIPDYFPKWSPTENLIAFSNESPANHVIIYNMSSETRQQYDGNSIGDWSPDGKFLTFYRRDKDQNIVISVLDVVTKEIIELNTGITTISTEAQPTWSPDSRYLAFTKNDGEGNYQKSVYILDVLKNNLQSTKINVGDIDPFVWSPTGNHLAIASDIEAIQGWPYFTSLWLYDADQRQSQQNKVKIFITGYERPISRSPKGHYLVIQNNDVRTLVDWASGKMEPARDFGQWSLDGSSLVLVIGGVIPGDIYVFTPENHTLKNVTNTPYEKETLLSWAGTQHDANHIGACGET